MHWANQTADWLIKNHQGEGAIVCASGISPSGHVHIGNFREIITTYFVAKAIAEKGVPVRFIFSWDDYDRFRKVPFGMDDALNACIGMPYSKVPDPFGCHNSYAAHFEAAFEETLALFDIAPEMIYQSDAYGSGVYTQQIRNALIRRGDIYDIITGYKTQETNPHERATYYPINLYCRACNKDTITSISYDEVEDIIAYKCACGHHEYAELEGFNRIKLTWKVDWPMRWAYESVAFEPGGRDHSSENGSFTVSTHVAKDIFSYPAPHYVPYEFIGIKGNSAKMSSSTGHLITPLELLKIYPKEIILFMFAKYQPNVAFDIGIDEDVIRYYTEYERYLDKFESLDKDLQETMLLSGSLQSHMHKAPKFSTIVSTLPLLNFDRQLLMQLLSEYDFTDAHVLGAFEQKCDHATYWLKNINSRQLTTIQDTFNSYFYSTLNEQERLWVEAFKNLIDTQNLFPGEAVTRAYDIVQDDDPNMRRKLQKRFFEIIYRLVLGQRSGPQIGILIQIVEKEQMVRLLTAS